MTTFVLNILMFYEKFIFIIVVIRQLDDTIVVRVDDEKACNL